MRRRPGTKRIELYSKPQTKSWLERRAKELGISEGQLVDNLVVAAKKMRKLRDSLKQTMQLV